MENRKNPLTKIDQIGVVTNDLDAAIEGMRKVFGVEPDKIVQTERANKTYHGKKANYLAKIAFYSFANIEYEIIMPIEGDSVQNDFVKSGGNGLHHIRFNIDNFDGVKSAMEERGFAAIQTGNSIKGGGVRWAYYDTEKALGFPVEVSNLDEVSR